MTLAQQSSKNFSFTVFPVCGVTKCCVSVRRSDAWRFIYLFIKFISIHPI